MIHDPHHTPELHEQPGTWHRHTTGESAPQTEHGSRVQPAVLGVAVLAIIIGVFAMIGVTWVYYNSYVTHMRRTVIETDAAMVLSEQERAAALSLLASGGVAGEGDQAQTFGPMNEAMNSVIQEYAQASNGN